MILIAKGKHGPLGWWSVAEGIANIVLSIVWGMSHGLLGVAMGTIVPMLIMKIIIQPWYALRAVEMSAWEYLGQGLGRPLLVGLLFFVIAGRISIGAEATIPLFAATVAVQAIVFFACMWVLGLTKAERKWLSQYGRQYLRSRVPRKSSGLSAHCREVELQ